MRRNALPIDGWLILDKPQGLTSTQAVSRVRRAFNAQKAGHGGTLDPLATGVLPVALGKATKTVPFVVDSTKIYRFTLVFGEARDTDDAEGAVTGQSRERPSDDRIWAELPRFIGEILQTPPAFSALKIAGERAYDLARAGQTVELAPRRARVDRFELIERPDADTAIFEVQSGKGVYMRALARDLALACGTLGHIAVLRRLRAGPFDIADAVTLDAISLDKSAQGDDTPPTSPDLLRPVSTALADIPALALTEQEALRFVQGQAIGLLGRSPAAVPSHSGLVRALAGERVIGLGRIEDALLKPERIL